MRTMKRVLTTAVMVSAGILFAEAPKGKCPNKAAIGQQKRSCERPTAGRGCASMLKDLNLNEEQKTAIKQLHEKHMAKMKETRSALTEARQKLMKLQTNKDVSEEAIKAASSQLADATSQMAMNRVKMRKEINSLLTPEQQSKLDKNMTEMKEGMEKRMQEMRKKMEAHRNQASEKGAKASGNKGCGKGPKASASKGCCKGPKANANKASGKGSKSTSGVKKSCSK